MEPLLDQLVERGLALLRQWITVAVADAMDAALAARGGIWPECRACCEHGADNFSDDKGKAPMVTREQFAAELVVDLATVDRYRDKGEIRSYKIGSAVRFKRQDVDDFIERHRQDGGSSGDADHAR